MLRIVALLLLSIVACGEYGVEVIEIMGEKSGHHDNVQALVRPAKKKNPHGEEEESEIIEAREPPTITEIEMIRDMSLIA